MGEEDVGGDSLERVVLAEAVGDWSGGGGGGAGVGGKGGDGCGGKRDGEEARVPARVDEEEVAAQGEG